MDQIKIGKFIAEMRKEQGITQKQLADRLEISDKTISKWECGNGLPEISLMMPLCDVLKINVNELLSGERLPAEEYTRKAEENMMNLILENEENKKKNGNGSILITILCTMAAILFAAAWVAMEWKGEVSPLHYWDMGLFVAFLVMELLLITAAGQWKYFLQTFGIMTGKKEYTQEEMKLSLKALDYVGEAALAGGAFITILLGIMMLYHMDTPETIGKKVACALLSLFYGVLEYLIIQPIKSRIADKLWER